MEAPFWRTTALAAALSTLVSCVDEAGTAASVDTALPAIRAFIAEQKVDRQSPGWREKLVEPPVATFASDRSYFWDLETNHGAIRIRFDPDLAPMHVTSAIYLTELGFYDGLRFHRVIPGFMAQGGCPLGTGTGGPGYQLDAEIHAKNQHQRFGLLSAANSGPNTDGSQFFITFGPTAWLDTQHTIYGKVVRGTAAVRALEAAGSESGTPTAPLELIRATVSVE